MIATSKRGSKHWVTSTFGGGSGGVSGLTVDRSPTSAPTYTKRTDRLRSQAPLSRARAARSRELPPWATSWESPEGPRPSRPVRCTEQRCGVRPAGSATPPRTLQCKEPSSSPRRRPPTETRAWRPTPRPWRLSRPHLRPQQRAKQQLPVRGVRRRQPRGKRRLLTNHAPFRGLWQRRRRR